MKGAFPLPPETGNQFFEWAAFLRNIDFMDLSLFTLKDWEPDYGAGGAMTFTNVTTSYAKYLKINKIVIALIQASGTTGGVASNTLNFTLPFTIKDNVCGFGGGVVDVGYGAGAIGVGAGSKRLDVFKFDASNFGLGAGRFFNFFCIYETI